MSPVSWVTLANSLNLCNLVLPIYKVQEFNSMTASVPFSSEILWACIFDKIRCCGYIFLPKQRRAISQKKKKKKGSGDPCGTVIQFSSCTRLGSDWMPFSSVIQCLQILDSFIIRQLLRSLTIQRPVQQCCPILWCASKGLLGFVIWHFLNCFF